MVQPLAGFRLLELGADVATRYVGRLFAYWGAEVTRLAPEAGDDARLGFAGEFQESQSRER